MGTESGQDLVVVVVLRIPIMRPWFLLSGPHLPLPIAVLVCLSGLSEGQSPPPALQCAVNHCYRLPVADDGELLLHPSVLCGFPPPTREPGPATASCYQSPSNFPTVLVASHLQIPHHCLQTVPGNPAGVVTVVDKSPTCSPNSCWRLSKGTQNP